MSPGPAHSPFGAIFTPGTRFAREDGVPFDIHIHTLGELRVPTGRIIAADPLASQLDVEGMAFDRQTPTGVFPVEVAIAHARPDRHHEVACARIRFAPPSVRAVRWEVAIWPGEAPGGLPGYGVDAGTGCFLDEAAGAAVDEATSNTWLEAMEKNTRNAWTWHIAELGQANIIMFSSNGDGIYTSYWGLDAGGQVVELVTDFKRLTAPAYEQLELPWPLPPGQVQHPFLQKHHIVLRMKKRLWRSPILSLHHTKAGLSRLTFSEGTPLQAHKRGSQTVYTWKETPPGTRLVVHAYVGRKPLEPL